MCRRVVFRLRTRPRRRRARVSRPGRTCSSFRARRPGRAPASPSPAPLRGRARPPDDRRRTRPRSGRRPRRGRGPCARAADRHMRRATTRPAQAARRAHLRARARAPPSCDATPRDGDRARRRTRRARQGSASHRGPTRRWRLPRARRRRARTACRCRRCRARPRTPRRRGLWRPRARRRRPTRTARHRRNTARPTLSRRSDRARCNVRTVSDSDRGSAPPATWM